MRLCIIYMKKNAEQCMSNEKHDIENYAEIKFVCDSCITLYPRALEL